jgi:RNA recognition motif-containing protein
MSTNNQLLTEKRDHANLPMENMSNNRRGYELFVGNTSFFCNEVDLFELFSKFGKVIRVRMKRSGIGLNGGRTLMYGFVEMADLINAQDAVKSLHGTRHLGRDIR